MIGQIFWNDGYIVFDCNTVYPDKAVPHCSTVFDNPDNPTSTEGTFKTESMVLNFLHMQNFLSQSTLILGRR